ncbi:MAG: HIT domain-containing protein, partial [Gemmatimonadota bacterium]
MDCIFCRIAAGEIPAQVVARTSGTLAFRDLSPQAPTHVLVIPTHHVASTADLPPADRASVLGDV